MNFFTSLWREALLAWSPWLLLVSVAAWFTSRNSSERRRFKGVWFFLLAQLVALVTTAALQARGSEHAGAFRLPTWLFGAVAFVLALSVLLFDTVLPRLHLRTPRILRDVLVAGASVVVCVTVASRANVSLSGLIATSAVLTAMLGFSLQDVIGNVAGGLALQVDNSVEEGDWIKVGEHTGRVVEIRWRHTAIETRNWETVLVPNAVLMKSQVTVLGRRRGQPKLLRRWVHFNVDWAHQPSDVVNVVQTALRSAKLQRVAPEPPVNCVLMDMTDSFGRYAVRYWLTDLANDDPTDSEVRTCVYFALQRADMRLAQPSQSVLVTEASPDRAASKTEKQLERRKKLLERIDLFAALSDDERAQLAAELKYSPFTRGEVMTKEGAEAHWLYLVEDGQASVRVGDGALEREVASLTAPTVFGEMSLLTGERRAATVVATSDVECFRLDKVAVQRILASRPALAEQLAALLAKRRAALVAAKEDLSADALRAREATDARDLLSRIKRFLAIDARES